MSPLAKPKEGFLNQPITANTAIKIAGVVSTVISIVISIVWYCASVQGAITNNEQKRIDDDKQIAMRQQQTDQTVTDLKAKADDTNKTVNECKDKIDVLYALVQRIDKKTGGN